MAETAYNNINIPDHPDLPETLRILLAETSGTSNAYLTPTQAGRPL